MLDADFIKNDSGSCRIAKQVLVYECTSSTNDVAAEYAKGGPANDGLVVLAERQTAGRGRRASSWISGRGKSVLCSVVLYESKIDSGMLSLVCAVAAAKTIDLFTKNIAKIKWPNDIFINGKKAAGILVEAKSVRRQNCFIIGVGINCLQREDDFKGELENIATSIAIETQILCDRGQVAKKLVENLEKYLKMAVGNPEKILEIYKSKSILLGKRIVVESDGKRFTGNCIAIEPIDGIVLQLDRGGVRAFEPAVSTIIEGVIAD